MLFPCLIVEIDLPAEKLRLVNPGAARLRWDEHGGTFVLRLEGPEVRETPELQEGGIYLEVALPEPASLIQRIEGFAGRHSLRLAAGAGVPELAEAPFLAAFHIPGKNLFIYCEDSRFTLRPGSRNTLELRIDGVFKSRRVPSQEADLVLHFEAAAMARLLAGMLAWARTGA